MSFDITLIKGQLEKFKMAETEKHLYQALSSFENNKYEAANAQLRTCLESFFNFIAKLLLNSTKTGGAARKDLFEKNYISLNENELLKYFFKIAGEKGSHPGRSNKYESQSNIQIGIGIMTRMLSLFPNEITVSKAFELAGINTNGAFLNEKDFITECPTCLESQTLDLCKISKIGDDTLYECKNGCQTIVIVTRFVNGTKATPERGYRIKDYVIRNSRDIFITINNNKVLIPASKNAFRK